MAIAENIEEITALKASISSLEQRVATLERIVKALMVKEIDQLLVTPRTSVTTDMPDQMSSSRYDAFKIAGAMSSMTQRQRATLFALVSGSTYDNIAKAMSVDITTVKVHAKAVYKVMGIKSLKDLRESSNELLPLIKSLHPEKVYALPTDWIVSMEKDVLSGLKKSRTTTPPPPGGKKKL